MGMIPTGSIVAVSYIVTELHNVKDEWRINYQQHDYYYPSSSM